MRKHPNFLGILLSAVLATTACISVSAEEIEPLAESSQGIKTWLGTSGYSGEGPENLFDYNETTKWCHGEGYTFCIWEMPQAVSVTAYQMVTANDTAENPGRNPSTWVLYGSNDYDTEADSGTWEEIHVVEGDTVLQGVNFTPFLFELDKAAPAYKFYQLEITELADGNMFQLSGFNLIFDGQAAQTVRTEEEIQAEKAAAVQAALDAAVKLNKVDGIVVVSATEGYPDNEPPANLFDYDTSTKMYNGNSNVEVVWEMPNAVAVTGYQLTTANDTESNPARNPKNWILYGSNDGSNWNVIDTKTDDTTMFAANYIPFDFMLDAAAPEYKFFKMELSAGGNFQLSEINLIFDGAVTEAEEVVEEPVVEEAAEEVVETPVVEEIVEAPAAEETSVNIAPQTFDFAVFAVLAAIISAAGCTISKKK